MKTTISKYGWLVVTVLVVSILIGLAIPAANYMKDKGAGVVGGLGDKLQSGQDYTMPYTVSLKTNIADAGTVTFTGEHSGTKVDLRGTNTLTFTATENTGYIFLGWYVGDTLISEDMEYTTGYTVTNSCVITAKYEVGLAAGLYAEGDVLVASWDELVNTYGMDVTKEYTYHTYNTDTASPYYVLTNNTELANGIKLVIDNSVTHIGRSAFYNCTNLTSVTIPDSVTAISREAFYYCENLVNVTLPNNLQEIREFTFAQCAITDIEIPDSVITIWDRAFMDCANLTSVTFGENSQLTKICGGVFENCTSLKNITIPDGVTLFMGNPFRGCTDFNITILAITPPQLDSDSHDNWQSWNNITTITVPAGCADAYKTANRWSSWASKIVEAQ